MKTIKMTVYSLAIALSMGSLTSCGDDDGNNITPPPAGYTNSDEIGASNLVAKWSFENNATDSKTGNVGTQTEAAYTAGAKGQAWEGSSSEARYSVYDGMTAVGNLNSFTIAFWMNSAGTVADTGTPEQGKGTQGIFALVKPDEFWGAMNVFLENPSADHPNRLRLKYLFENERTGINWVAYGPIVNIDGELNEWIHVVMTYDATTSRFSSYVNGIPAANIEAAMAPEGGYTTGSFIAFSNDPGDLSNPNNVPLWGNINWGGTYSKVVLGSHQFTTTPSLTSSHGTEAWSTTYAGKLDEFRLYNIALSGSDVGSLYELEKNGF
ncbi:LamG-like jellyroll fold domain-containing protein [Flavobacterium sp.]|uniref:LamG-like jellyroll fold domain-containing protein n=1 Tax=Flavobacterium sp. TaxID=239 RepID=UPI0039E6D1A6